jgi:hypothetical protein
MGSCMDFFSMKKFSLLLIICVAGCIANAQSLKDSLFGGKLKRDTTTPVVTFTKPIVPDSIIYISVDTSQAAKDEAIKKWERFLNGYPALDPEMDTKVRDGEYKLLAHYIVQPDGSVRLLDEIKCDISIEYMKSWIKKNFMHAPPLIPSHNNGVYIPKVRRFGVLYTITRKTTTAAIVQDERKGVFTLKVTVN